MSSIKNCITIYTILIVINAIACFIDLPVISSNIQANSGVRLHILPTIINSFLFLILVSISNVLLQKKASETILKALYIGVSFFIYLISVIFLFAGAYIIGGEYGALALFLITLLVSHGIIFYTIHPKSERSLFILSSILIMIVYFTMYIVIPAKLNMVLEITCLSY